MFVITGRVEDGTVASTGRLVDVAFVDGVDSCVSPSTLEQNQLDPLNDIYMHLTIAYHFENVIRVAKMTGFILLFGKR